VNLFGLGPIESVAFRDHKPAPSLIPEGPAGTLARVQAADSPLLRAARRQPTDFTPVWLMRQAGRYLPEYRAMRERFGFLELCRNPEAAAEVTLQPVERLGVDAAILFADILLLVEPMGVGLEFAKGEGPAIQRPVRSAAAVRRLHPVDPQEATPFVFETVRRVCRALDDRVPVIGFAGAPFTVASYLIEGGASREFLHTKRLMYEEPEAWHTLLGMLADVTARYLSGQIAAGADAVQLFDSWAGALSPDDYRVFVLPHSQALLRALSPGTPVIHFGTGTAALLPLMAEAGGDVIGLDWRVNLDDAWARLGPGVAVQGNLDPAVLLAPPERIRQSAQRILDRAGGRPGHIFNLGHGVLPETPVDNVIALVDMVHELSKR
jgi:uroporphyrinogen decarboxylase